MNFWVGQFFLWYESRPRNDRFWRTRREELKVASTNNHQWLQLIHEWKTQEETVAYNDGSPLKREWKQGQGWARITAFSNVTLPSAELWTRAASHSISINRFQVEWWETHGTNCALYPLSLKRKRRNLKTTWSLWTEALGAYIQGAPKGCHNPRGDYRDQYALRVKSNQRWKKSRCPEIMRTGPELASTAPITGDQGLFTDIEKRQ